MSPTEDTGHYEVHIHRRVNLVLYGLDKELATRIRNQCWAFQQSRFPEGYEKVQGLPNSYKITVDGYKLEYEVVSERNIVRVLRLQLVTTN